MSKLSVEQQNLIRELRQAYPEELRGLSDEQILTIYNEQLSEIKLNEDQQVSVMGLDLSPDESMGLALQSTTQPQIKQLNEEEKEQLRTILLQRINVTETKVEEAKSKNGFFQKLWSGIKNTVNIGDSSEDVVKAKQEELKLLSEKNIELAFKEITGQELTEENYTKFLNSELKTKSEQALDAYTEGQEMVHDTLADMGSGILSFVAYTACVAAAPVTGGLSIALGVGLATGVGAGSKLLIKRSQAKKRGEEYTSKNMKDDLITGALSGLLAPFTGGAGSAVGKTVAVKCFGMKVFKQAGKELVEVGATKGFKQGFKSAMLNAAGYEYRGSAVGVVSAYLAEMATDGALSGMVENGFRTAYEGGDAKEVLGASISGFGTGLVLSPVIGGGMRGAGKVTRMVLGKSPDIDAPTKTGAEVKAKQTLPPNVKSSLATDDDLVAIHKIDKENFEGSYAIDEDFSAYKADLDDREVLTYSLKSDDGKVMGYYQLEPIENGELYIYSIGVPPELQKTKSSYAVLKKIQDEITKTANEKGVKKVVLDVDADNKGLVKLYEKFGFKITGEESGFEAGSAYHDYRMEIDVDEYYAKQAQKTKIEEVVETSPDKVVEDVKIKLDERFVMTKNNKVYSREDVLRVFSDYKITDEETITRLMELPYIAETAKFYDFLKQINGEYKGAENNNGCISAVEDYATDKYKISTTDFLTKDNFDKIQNLLGEKKLVFEMLLNANEFTLKNAEFLAEKLGRQLTKEDCYFIKYCKNSDGSLNDRAFDLYQKTPYSVEFLTECCDNDGYFDETILDSVINLLTKLGVNIENCDLTSNKVIKKIADMKYCIESCRDSEGNFDSNILRSAFDFITEDLDTLTLCNALRLRNGDGSFNLECFKKLVELNKKLGMTYNDNKVLTTIKNDFYEFDTNSIELVYKIYKELGDEGVKDIEEYFRYKDTTDGLKKSALALIELPKFPLKDITKILPKFKLNADFDYVRKIYMDLIADSTIPVEKIVNALPYINPSNEDFAIKLIKKSVESYSDFSTEIISKILQQTKTQNITLAEKLCFGDFPKDKIASILSSVRKENIDLAEKLCFDPNFPKGRIANVIEYTNAENISLAEKLCFDTNFPKAKIAGIILNTRESNLSLANRMYAENRFSTDILKVTTSENLPLAEKLFFNSSLDMDSMARVLEQTDSRNISVAERICYDENILSHPNFIIFARTLGAVKDEAKIRLYNLVCDNKVLRENTGVVTYLRSLLNGWNDDTVNNEYKLLETFLNSEKLQKNELLAEHLGLLISNSNSATTMKNLTDYIQVLQDAFAKKDQLKSGTEDISDEIITARFNDKVAFISSAIDMFGISTFEATFPTKISGVLDLAEKLIDLRDRLENRSLYNDLLLKINPENSQEYKILEKAVADLKKTFPEVKASGDAVRLKELQNEIATYTKEMQAIRKSKVNLSPQKIIEKVRVLYAISQHNSDDLEKFLKLIQNGTKENEAIWADEVNKYIFKVMDMPFDKELSDRLNLTNSKYLAEILSGNSSFKQGFKEILELIQENPTKSLQEIFDELPQNIKTKKMFESFGIDYDKWCQVDKNSYVGVEVKLNLEESRQAAIEALEKEFNNVAFTSLPKAETDKIFEALKEIEVELKTVTEPNYDANGFIISTQEVGRLYKDGEPIKFEDLSKIMKTIKKSINDNPFWNVTYVDDSQINSYRETMCTHLTKDRDVQYKTARDLKEDKVVKLEIRKTDMNDISHSLFLGNHGACCTAVGTGGNQFSAPTYIKNKMVSAIEVVDGDNFVGNTMCYIAQVDGKPSLILDNIELKADYHNNDVIRDAMIEYAKKLCAEIGQPDMPIYAGPYRHKLRMEVFDLSVHNMQIVGNTGNDDIYLDFITRGRKVTGNEVDKVKLYKIR